MQEQASAPSYKRHRFPPEIIAHTVWRYRRFARSYRDVEELLAERGMILTDEPVRQWCRTFGQGDANALRRRRPQPGDQWHRAAVFMRINGATHSLWRAVDQDGHVLDMLVQSRRDEAAAVQFLRKLLQGLAYVPRVLITDTLARYGAARRAVPPGVAHRRHTGVNNRAEHSHQPTRERERRLRRCRSPGQAQRYPRRLRPDRQPLPPTPPPADRRRLSCDPPGTLRHLAGRHRLPPPWPDHRYPPTTTRLAVRACPTPRRY